MKIVVDTNIIFSAILKTESKIGQLLTNSSDFFQFYTVDYSRIELDKHKNKVIQLTKYSEKEYNRVVDLIMKKIKFFDESVIPINIIKDATELVHDIDDAYFIALTKLLKAKLWTGDKILTSNLQKKGFNRLITTDVLYHKFLLNIRKTKRY